jgi:hypothetical protein
MDDAFLEQWPTWLRWLLVVPAALAGFLAIQIVIVILSFFSGSWLSWLPDWAIQLINSAASGYALVYAAAWTAPRAKVVVAVSATILVAVIAGVALMGGLLIPTKSGPVVLALAALLTLAGSAAACWTAYEGQKNNGRLDAHLESSTRLAASPLPLQDRLDKHEEVDDDPDDDVTDAAEGVTYHVASELPPIEAIPSPGSAGLTPGCLVVHPVYGLGRYEGMTWREVHSDRKRFLALQFAKHTKLFVPVEFEGSLQPYTGESEVLATLKS